MSEVQRLIMLKNLLGINDTSADGLLQSLLSIAAQKILDRLYPFTQVTAEVPTRYCTKQVEIAVYLYNKRGAEGQIAHNENNISRTYESADVPESLLRGIIPHAEVIGFANTV